LSVNLHKELLTLRRHILSMGAAVEDRVRKAIDALFRHDMEEARHVRTGDDVIDAMDLDIEKEALRLLSLTQPVASDLRFILAVMRINNDLERIADLAKSISKRVLALGESPEPIELPAALREMADRTLTMLSDALAALSNNDAALCDTIRKDDDHVDDLLKELFAWAEKAIPCNVEATPAAISVLSIARNLERIADMTTNIAEDVVFIIHGKVVRHGQ
jgi:phosphate transport system protein